MNTNTTKNKKEKLSVLESEHLKHELRYLSTLKVPMYIHAIAKHNYDAIIKENRKFIASNKFAKVMKEQDKTKREKILLPLMTKTFISFEPKKFNSHDMQIPEIKKVPFELIYKYLLQ